MMPYTVKVQSYTDVITNSSSSVFLVKRNCSEIEELLNEVVSVYCKATGDDRPIDELMEISEEGDFTEVYTTYDNSIPYFIQQFLTECLDAKRSSIDY